MMTDISPEERAADLLAKMSLEEKIGQMTQVEKNSITPADVTRYYIGSVLSGGGGSPFNNTAEEWAEMVDGYQAAALATPLQIPLIYGVDAVHGHGNLKGATIFPHNIGLGAANDPQLVKAIGAATAKETAATGITWNFAPVLAVVHDVRWGRTYEAYSENTALVTSLSSAYIQGLQGDDLADPATILATAKHYIGDGGTTWGSSTTGSYMLDQGVTEYDEAALREFFLPPYQQAIADGAMSVMVSFSSWGGMKMHAQSYLINDVLKGELGFSGFVVSDWQGIDQISTDYYEAVVTAINAGVDMNMVPYNHLLFIETMKQAVEAGDITMERIDDAVSRILVAKFMLGLFEHPFADESLLASVGSAEHRALAREAVQKSLVLLKNENQALPIAKDVETIFVSGVGADDIGIQCGGWTIEWQGATGNITPGTTILEGIETLVSETTKVQFNRFGKFDNLKDANGNPLKADVGIVVISEKPYAEGVGDSATLALDEAQLNLVAKMRTTAEKVVLLVVSGRPILITDVIGDADAVVAAFLPGSEGIGVADVLFGDAPFTGKLPFTWLRSVDQLPFDFANMHSTGFEDALFPFGFGLER